MRSLTALFAVVVTLSCSVPPPIDLAEGGGDAGEGEGEGEGEEGEEGEGEEGEGEGNPLDGETNCADLVDDDGDGLIDCDDLAGCEDDAACAAGATPLGDGCVDSNECDAGARPLCISEAQRGFPGGLCTQWCSVEDQDCPAGFFCEDTLFFAGRGFCIERCEGNPATCKDGFACQRYEPFEACFPACADAGDCVDTGGVCFEGIGGVPGRCVDPEDCAVVGDEDEDTRHDCEDDECRDLPACSLDATCAAPVALPLDVDVEGDTTMGAALTGASCTGRFGGKELAYAVSGGAVGQTGTLTVQVSGEPNLGLYLRRTCDDVDSEVGCQDEGGPEEGDTLFAGVDGGVSYTLFVDGNSSRAEGAFTLRASFVADTCGDGNVTGGEACDDGDTDSLDGCSGSCQIELDVLCAAARPLAPGGVDGTTVDSASHYFQGSCTLPQNTANEELWTFTAERSGTASLQLANVQAGKDLAVYVRSACTDAATEVACADAAREGGTENVGFDVVAGQSYTVFVDGTLSSPFDDGSYALRLTLP